MNVLITGGAGFIGSHVTELLLRHNVKVTVLDNLSTGLLRNIPRNVEFLHVDIHASELDDLFRENNFDAVIHLAAQTMVPVSLERPYFDCGTNVAGTVNVLEACRKANVKRIIFASSAAVYGGVDQLPVLETSPKIPTSFYGLSKLVAERYIELYQQHFGLEFVILRFANVFGERQGDGGEGGVVSIFTRNLRQGKPIIIFGDGGQTRDFIYVGDVAAAIRQALTTPNANRIYNISTETETSVNQLVKYLSSAAGVRINPVYREARPGDIYRSYLSNREAKEDLGWSPNVPLREGIERTYQSLCPEARELLEIG